MTSGVTPGSEAKVSEGHSKVRSMATLLLAKFEENSPSASATALRRQVCEYSCDACVQAYKLSYHVLTWCNTIFLSIL